MAWIKSAWLDTWRQLGSASGVFLLISGPVIALLALYFLYGRNEAVEELNPFIAGFAGLGVSVFAIFIWNLLSAPYRLEKKRADQADERIKSAELSVDDLSKRLTSVEDRRARLELTIGTFLHSGKLAEKPEIAPVCVFLYVKNVGELPTCAFLWGFDFLGKDGQITSRPHDIVDRCTFDDITVMHDNTIYEKTMNPVPGGGIVAGFIVIMTEREFLKKQSHVRVYCTQTNETRVEGDWMDLTVNLPKKSNYYLPGMGDPFRG